MTNRGRRRAEVLCVAGGGALLASTFVHWVRHGSGSRLRGHDLIDTLLALDSLPGASTSRLLVLWYLVPAMGAATWIVVGWCGVDSLPLRVVAGSAVVVVAVVVFVFARLAGLTDLGAGPALAVLGTIAIVAGAFDGRGPTAPTTNPSGHEVLRIRRDS